MEYNWDGVSVKLVLVTGILMKSYLTINLWWPITVTAITKRNVVNKEILINKKSFAHI